MKIVMWLECDRKYKVYTMFSAKNIHECKPKYEKTNLLETLH